MLPEAYLSHSTSRRFRMKVPAKKGSDAFFRALVETISTLPGIESVETNSLTGSVLVCHHSDTPSLCESIRKQSLISLKNAGTKRTSLRQDITTGVRAVNRNLSSLTGGKVDLLDVAGIYLLGAGVYQVFKGNLAAPAWYTAFWYAFGIMSKSPSSGNTVGE